MANQADYTPSVSRPVTGEACQPETSKGLREVGHLAVWTVSSAKAGNGVDALRDGRMDTFWQSDGMQPHLVNIQFQRRTDLSELQLFFDYKTDESYTPNKISIRAGTTIQDLREIKVVELDEPNGCIKVPLSPSGQEGQPQDAAPPLSTFFVQVAVLSNHQNGRDTHVRLIRVYGPRIPHQSVAELSLPCSICTPEFAAYATVR